jgi:hypothetical protein
VSNARLAGGLEMQDASSQQQPFTYGALSGSEDFYFAAK